jgi:hypothetical protein
MLTHCHAGQTMTALIDIYLRGVAIVTLVSWNTTLLAEARRLRGTSR